MDLNFDYREFQRDTMERLTRVYAESLVEEQDDIELANEIYNKIQKILDCTNMEKCHPYLFTLDRQHLNEDDRQKVNELYECGVKRGFIKEDDQVKTECEQYDLEKCCDNNGCCDDDSLCGGPEDSLTNRPLEQKPQPQVETRPTFNVLYSAMKNGDVKLGEFYSKAADIDSAKNDCTNTLSKQGYGSVSILAIEQNTSAIDTNIQEYPSGQNLYGMFEDDSSEYEKQETGDDSSDTSSTNDSSSDNETSSDSNSEDTNTTSDDSNNEGGNESNDSEASFSSDEETSSNDGSDDTQNDDTQADDTENTNSSDDESDNTENTEDNTEKEDQESSKKDNEETTDSEEKTEDGTDNSEKNEKDSETTDTNEKDDKSEMDEEKKLTPQEKENLRDEYTKTFKDVLRKVSTEKCVQDMTIQEKSDFYSKLLEKWTKYDPQDFMKDKEIERLNKYIAKPEEK